MEVNHQSEKNLERRAKEFLPELGIITKSFRDTTAWREKQVRSILLAEKYVLAVLLAIFEEEIQENCERLSLVKSIFILNLVSIRLIAEFSDREVVLWQGYPCRHCFCSSSFDPEKKILNAQLTAKADRVIYSLEMKSKMQIYGIWIASFLILGGFLTFCFMI